MGKAGPRAGPRAGVNISMDTFIIILTSIKNIESIKTSISTLPLRHK